MHSYTHTHTHPHTHTHILTFRRVENGAPDLSYTSQVMLLLNDTHPCIKYLGQLGKTQTTPELPFLHGSDPLFVLHEGGDHINEQEL